MELKYEFCLEECCIDDMKHYAKKRQISEKDWDFVMNKARLEAENLYFYGKFWRSERIKGIDEYHIRKLRAGNWRLLLLVEARVYVIYGIGFWNRADAYKKHDEKQLIKRAEMVEAKITI